MHIAGIVAEYNPFHKGHQYHIAQTRLAGATHVLAVMSGNFTQRGEPALLPKHARAEMALQCGVDLVLELPLPYAMSGAQTFAMGAVALMKALGCVRTLSFGSECGDAGMITALSCLIDLPEVTKVLPRELEKGLSFAAARENAVARTQPTLAPLLRSANDTLAVEYLRAVRLQSCEMQPLAVRREGAPHDGLAQDGGFCSASQLRERLRKGEACTADLPRESAAVISREMQAERLPADQRHLELAILAKLRTLPKLDFALLPDLSEGLENRLQAAAQQACSLEELFTLTKTKRYPLARVRRLVWSAFLGIRKQDASEFPPYLRVLALNERGREILRQARKSAALPVILRTAEIRNLNEKARRIFQLECASTDVYQLCLPSPRPGGGEYTQNVVRRL